MVNNSRNCLFNNMFYDTKEPIKSAVRRRRILQFCIFNFDFCVLKLTIGQFEVVNMPAAYEFVSGNRLIT